MALSLSAQQTVSFLDDQINLLLYERDRLINLFSDTLPDKQTMWSVLTPDLQNSIKGAVKENISVVVTNLPNLLSMLDQTKLVVDGKQDV